MPLSFYAVLTRQIQADGARVLLDTSGEALRHGVAAGPFLVKPNAAEAGELTGLPVSSLEEVVAAARAIEAVPHVVVSMSRHGALLVERGQAWLAAPPSIRERNPIGAGDSLGGGLVWSLSRGETLPEALRWGTACGAVTAGHPGTIVGTAGEVRRLAAQVMLRSLDLMESRES